MFHKTHQSIHEVLASRGYKLRSKNREGMQMIDGCRFTLHSAGYLRGTVNGRRILASHYVWEKYHGKVPPGHKLFYLDGNKMNNNIGNLKLIPMSQMLKACNPSGYRGKKQRKKTLVERVKEERESRWQRAIAIG